MGARPRRRHHARRACQDHESWLWSQHLYVNGPGLGGGSRISGSPWVAVGQGRVVLGRERAALGRERALGREELRVEPRQPPPCVATPRHRPPSSSTTVMRTLHRRTDATRKHGADATAAAPRTTNYGLARSHLDGIGGGPPRPDVTTSETRWPAVQARPRVSLVRCQLSWSLVGVERGSRHIRSP